MGINNLNKHVLNGRSHRKESSDVGTLTRVAHLRYRRSGLWGKEELAKRNFLQGKSWTNLKCETYTSYLTQTGMWINAMQELGSVSG